MRIPNISSTFYVRKPPSRPEPNINKMKGVFNFGYKRYFVWKYFPIQLLSGGYNNMESGTSWRPNMNVQLLLGCLLSLRLLSRLMSRQSARKMSIWASVECKGRLPPWLPEGYSQIFRL